MKGFMGLFVDFIKTPAVEEMLGIPMGGNSFTTPAAVIHAPTVTVGVTTPDFHGTLLVALPNFGSVPPIMAPLMTIGPTPQGGGTTSVAQTMTVSMEKRAPLAPMAVVTCIQLALHRST